MPTTGELANQNIKDRYWGHNDPVAKKMLNRSKALQDKIPPPDDQSITTLYVGGLDHTITEADLRIKFATFGPISSITIPNSKSCAFVTYSFRSAAEDAANRLLNNLVIHGIPLRLDWGKKASGSSSTGIGPVPPGVSGAGAPPGMRSARASTGHVTGQPLVLNREANKHLTVPNLDSSSAIVPPPPGITQLHYPSQRPDFQSTKLHLEES